MYIVRSRLLAVALVMLSSCGLRGAPEPPAVPRQVQLALAPTWGNCILSWAAPDTPVDGYDLEVSPNGWLFVDPPGGIPGEATRAELDFGSVGNPELTEVSVGIRARRGTLVSKYSEPVSCKLPIKPPDEVMAVVASNGIALSWRSFSSLTTSFQIERSELDAVRNPRAWAPIGSVPKIPGNGFDFKYLDMNTSVGNAYGYRVTAVASADRSEGRETATLVLGVPLLETIIHLPLGIMVTDGRGHYVYTASPQGLPPNVVRFTWGDGQTWTSMDVAGITEAAVLVTYPPGIKLDASGLPHAVYPRPQAGGGVQVIHGWPDGTQWREETIAVRGSTITSNLTQVFDLDTSGNPVIAWVSDGKLEAASKRAGAWEVTSLATFYPDVSAIQTSYMFADQAGTAHLLVGERKAIRHLQPQDGVWTSEALPLPPIKRYIDSPVLGVGHDPDHLVVFLQTLGPDVASTVPSCLRKTPSGWGAVESLGTLPFTGGAWDDLGALSPDGRRLALLSRNGYPFTAHVFRSNDGGPWSETSVTDRSFPFPGFTSGGKFQVFWSYPTSSGVGPQGDYPVEIEP
jgi:hypothetical protein